MAKNDELHAENLISEEKTCDLCIFYGVFSFLGIDILFFCVTITVWQNLGIILFFVVLKGFYSSAVSNIDIFL